MARALTLGAAVVHLPKLNEAAMTQIDARSTSFWAACQSADRAATGLGLLERQRVKVWLGKAYAALAPLNL